MHRITDSSRTHGTQPVSEDSMPSAGLYVRLIPLSIFYILSVLHFSPSPLFLLPLPLLLLLFLLLLHGVQFAQILLGVRLMYQGLNLKENSPSPSPLIITDLLTLKIFCTPLP